MSSGKKIYSGTLNYPSITDWNFELDHFYVNDFAAVDALKVLSEKISFKRLLKWGAFDLSLGSSSKISPKYPLTAFFCIIVWSKLGAPVCYEFIFEILWNLGDVVLFTSSI